MVKVTRQQKRKTVLSGSIWRKPPRVRAQTVRRVCESLESTYGLPRLGNPRNPIDDIIYIVLSNKTAPTTAVRTYRRLKSRFPRWENLLRARPSTLRSLLKPAGLSGVKSQQIRDALKKIRSDFARLSLARVRGWPDAEAQRYLTSLPGVSEKVAKCVMLYTLGGHVLPVDAHVHRIATRLGWTARKRADQCHAELELLVPPRRRHAFHVDCVVHGRSVCRPISPLCGECCIRRHCEYYRKHDPKKR